MSGADSYLYEKGILPIPLPAFFLLLSVFIPVFLINLVKDHGQELQRIYLNTARITIPFGIIALISLVWGLLPEANWEENGRYIYFNSYHLVLLIFSIGLANSQIMRKYHRLIILTSLLSVSFSIGVDLVSPGTFSYQTSRGAGFMADANDGALTVLYLTIASINWKKNDLLNLFVLFIAGAAIFATLSMGTLFFFLITTVLYVVSIWKRNSSALKNLAYILTFIALTLFIVVPLGMDIIGSMDGLSHQDSQSRIQEMSTMGQGDLTFVEEHARLELIKVYMGYIMDAPIIGHGTGFTVPGENESHNTYIKMWTQNGFFGLLAYLSLMFFSFYHFKSLKDMRGMVFIFIISGASFYDHNILNNKTFVGLLGILGTLAYLEYSKAPQRIRQNGKWSW